MLDEDNFEDMFIELWKELVSIASAAAMEKGIATDYFANPDIRKIFKELNQSNYLNQRLLNDYEELIYFHNTISNGNRDIFYQFPIKEKKMVLNKLHNLIYELEQVTYGPMLPEGYLCTRCKKFTVGMGKLSNVCVNCGYVDPD